MGFLSAYTKEFKYNLKLAIPVITALLGHTFVQLIDNIMVGQLGTASLAAISLGNSFFWVAMSVGVGFSTAITPLIAEADGQRNILKGKKVLIHGFLSCIFLGIALSIFLIITQPFLYEMGQPKEVVDLAFKYLFWVAISLIPLLIFQAFKQFSDGLSYTKPSMYASLLANIFNIILNYMLIFGNWGAPAMGIEGAALGTLISRVLALLFMMIYILIDKKFAPYVKNITEKGLDKILFFKIFKIGFPSAAIMFFEITFFTCAVWLSGLLGKNPQAANQIALNLSTVTYMVAMGFGVAAMIRVGNQKGKSNYIELRRVAISIFLLIFIFDFIFCVIFLLFHDQLPWLYLDFENSSNVKDIYEVVKLSSGLLIISAFFQISDGLQAVVLGALRGLQDVNLPALIAFFSYVLIGLPISYILGIKLNFGVNGIWFGLLSGLTSSSILLFLRFQYLTKKLILKNAKI
ncbi:MAG: MATE family efflux transporter [Flavobacteriaceae bacterium]|nr:MATE family efflux transporter [Flavobacteriaceae bacterium]|tara:strand:- start:1424 stop:2809 length:1386 start_codon:yes stop_codon:yes gene_type:complete